MIATQSAPAVVRIISKHGSAEIIENVETKEKSLRATRKIQKGELLHGFSAGKIFSKPNYLTVQVGVDKHIALAPEFLQYINHSCDPNVFFDTSTFEVRTLRDIDMNEEFTFFYPSTELDMAQPFNCYCGSGCCLQTIRGAVHIDRDVLKNYDLTDFIKSQLNF